MYLEIVHLTADASKKIGAYSGGMKQRLLLARALLNDPQILIPDEPTAGLDSKARIRIRTCISSIALNKIVILATPIVSDVEYIADEIILLKQGRIVGQDEYAKILDRVRGKVYRIRFRMPNAAIATTGRTAASRKTRSISRNSSANPQPAAPTPMPKSSAM